MFNNQRDCKVYVDDMLVKARKEAGHVVDMEKAFSVLRKYNMRLNSMKCALL